jgi:hypothetical protein
MKYLDLIEIQLKDDFLLDLFETYDVEVVYEYDRTHENIPDQYRAEIPDLGLQFVFDEGLRFRTLFIQQVEVTTWNPFDDDERLRRFGSKADAQRYATENGEQTTEGRAELMGEEKDWIRFEYGTYSIHYEFVKSMLSMITIQHRFSRQEVSIRHPHCCEAARLSSSE